MSFKKGEKVEICNKSDGFIGSYYSATVVSPLGKYAYLVQHEQLLEDDKSGPLREIVPFEDVRPLPPNDMHAATRFSMADRVDAYHKDGWWTGRIVGKKGLEYFVHFHFNDEEKGFPISKLRMHVDWRYGRWISEKKKKKKEEGETPKKARVVQDTGTSSAACMVEGH